MQTKIARLRYRIFSDKRLMELGWLIAEHAPSHYGAAPRAPRGPLSTFLFRLLRPFIDERKGWKHPNLTLHEAQAAAVQAYHHSTSSTHDIAELPTTARQHPELTAEFPETGRVGNWQLIEIEKDLKQNRLEDMPSLEEMMLAFPEFAGAIAIIATVHGDLPDTFHKEFEAIAAEYRRIDSEGGDRPTIDTALQRLRTRFIELYRSERRQEGLGLEPTDAIRRGLLVEVVPGTTRNEWLTGVESPWEPAETTWDEMDPLDRLALVMPEAFQITEQQLTAWGLVIKEYRTFEISYI